MKLSENSTSEKQDGHLCIITILPIILPITYSIISLAKNTIISRVPKFDLIFEYLIRFDVQIQIQIYTLFDSIKSKFTSYLI